MLTACSPSWPGHALSVMAGRQSRPSAPAVEAQMTGTRPAITVRRRRLFNQGNVSIDLRFSVVSGKRLVVGLIRHRVVPQLGDVVQDDAGAMGLDAEATQGGKGAGQILLPAAESRGEQPLVEGQSQHSGIDQLLVGQREQ